MKTGFRKLLKSVAVIMTIIFLGSSLRAQTYFGITPIRFELKLAAAGQKTELIYVRNNSSRPIRLKVYTENWSLTEDGTRNFMGSQPTSFSCRDWIKVNPFDFRLQPGEMKSVRFTVSVPAKTEPGGYHAGISFEQVPETPAGARLGQVAFVGKIVAAVYVLVGKVPVEGSLEDLVLATQGEVQLIKIKLNNTGRVHFRLKGEVRIMTAEGKKAANLEIPDEPVLPQSQRWVAIQLKEKLPPGKYKAEVRLEIGREELLALEKEIIIN
ncbi:MAG: hypothetical protein NUW07_00115 [Candidatus Saccharicenans sp.]|jgi:P pilus assembly chaperone PapD|nr:hypothetical protein [Candidatus Saccharicenans sp.]MDH7493135.1 hypothetical protein [Candidatus Saccharicenans sp.]